MADHCLRIACPRCPGTAVTLFTLCSAIGGAAQTQDVTIPDELWDIVAACRENEARIQSLQLSGTVVLTGRRMEGQWDPIANRMYNSQTQQFSLWREAENFRFDVTTDRRLNERGEVIYNVPYGEHITSAAKLEREGGLREIRRKHGTPQTTIRRIVSPAGSYEYSVEQHLVSVDPPNLLKWFDSELGAMLARNKVHGGVLTTVEVIDRFARLIEDGSPYAPRSLEAMSLGDGQYQIRATFVYGEGNQTVCESFEAIVDLDKGGSVLSYVGRRGEQIDETGEFDYVNVGGAWLLARAQIDEFGRDGAHELRIIYEVAPQSVRVNEPIDAQVFTFEGLEVRKGARVYDHKTGEEYFYDDVPLHVKVALALAREKEEEQAEAAAQGMVEAALPADFGSAAPAEEGASVPPAPAAAKPTPGSRTKTSSITVVTPRSKAPTPTDTRPASVPAETQPAALRPVTTPIVPEARAAQAGDDQLPARPAVAETAVPGAVVTGIVVSAGVAAAIGIGMWKLAHRGTTARSRP